MTDSRTPMEAVKTVRYVFERQIGSSKYDPGGVAVTKTAEILHISPETVRKALSV